MFRPAFLAFCAIAVLVLSARTVIFRWPYLVFCIVLILALFGYARVFVPAPFLGYPFGIVYFLVPGALLATWVLHTFRGRLRFDWKWALLSLIVALFLWEGVAKGAGWLIIQATGTPYNEAFSLERNIVQITRNNLISGRRCPQRLLNIRLRLTEKLAEWLLIL